MTIHILAIDTTTESCSVALCCKGKIFTQFSISSQRHSNKILRMIEQCLIDAQLNLRDIDVLAFSRGPGSFTGIRVSIGIAQGLAFGATLPMIGISSLLTMAHGAYCKSKAKKILVTIDARIGDIYSACYELKSDGYWYGEDTEALLKPEQFLSKINSLSGQWAIAGNGWSIYPILKMTNLNLLDSGIFVPNAQDMLFLALQAWKTGKTINAEEAQAVYLRNEIVCKKKTYY